MKRFKVFLNEMIRHQKKWFGQWHTWAGIFAGSVLIVVSTTGSLLVFEEELDVWLNPTLFDYPKEEKRLSFQEVHNLLIRNHPEFDIHGIYRMPNRNDCYQVALEDFEQAIVNPYNGEVTGTRFYNSSTMGIIRNLHRTLLLGTFGKYMVGICSLFMVILMITGLRLWIPKKWSKLKESLTVKKGASFKRQNYDLHNSMGFYFSPFITLISLTGAAITFSPLVVLTLFLASFEPPKSIDEILGSPSEFYEGAQTLSIAEIERIALEEEPDFEFMGLTYPHDSIGTFGANMVGEGRAATGDFTIVNLDQYSGKVVMNVNDLPNLGKVYANWVTPIHYGTFGGLTTRIIALITTLMVPVLFISGFIIWWGRWKKLKSQKARNKDAKAIIDQKEEDNVMNEIYEDELVLQSKGGLTQ